MPDLVELAGRLNFDEERNSHVQTSTLSGSEIQAGEPLYYSISKISDEVQKIYLSESEVFKQGISYDINPLIYYRIKRPAKNLDELPEIDLSKFYKQSSDDSQNIKFSVK